MTGTPWKLSWLPDPSWWLTPSGTHHRKPYDLINYIQAPLIAHPIQGVLAALAVYPFYWGTMPGFGVWYASALWAVVWQLFNVERLTLVNYGLHNLIWRPLLAIVPVGAVILILNLLW